jgi:hypothetical protein
MIPCRALLWNQLPINNVKKFCAIKLQQKIPLLRIVSFGTTPIYIDAGCTVHPKNIKDSSPSFGGRYRKPALEKRFHL